MNVFYNGGVFELKNFTHKNQPEPYPFLFRPDHFGICFNTPVASKLPFRRALGGGIIPFFNDGRPDAEGCNSDVISLMHN